MSGRGGYGEDGASGKKDSGMVKGAIGPLKRNPFVRACRLGEDGAAAEEWNDEEGP